MSVMLLSSRKGRIVDGSQLMRNVGDIFMPFGRGNSSARIVLIVT